MSEDKSTRLGSIDCMRGMDMLFIIGLGDLIWEIGALSGRATWQMQVQHATWEGLHLYDLIFPLFVYISGISMYLSQQKKQRAGQTQISQIWRLWRRALILVFLGWLINGTLSWDPESMRFASVLGLIGLSGAMAGSITTLRKGCCWHLLSAVGILGTVWLIQQYCGDYSPQNCANAAIDRLLCPGQLHNVHYDPEGPLCILSATALSLLGYLSGKVLMYGRAWQRLLILTGSGATLLLLSSCGPIIKNIWSPAFVLAAAGWGFLLLAFFHLICDLLPHRKWWLPFAVVGQNALFIYLITHIIDFKALTLRIFGGVIAQLVPANLHGAAISTGFLLLSWLLCTYMYRHRIFIRL